MTYTSPLAMYTVTMKRLQIYIEEDIDQELQVRALRERTSKAALIRRFVAEKLGPLDRRPDPLDELVGKIDIDPGDIDTVVYGP